MYDTAEVIKKITPEIIELLERRYNILQTIKNNQPIGRRLLAEELNLGERIVRSEINILKEQQMLMSSPAGVSLTQEYTELAMNLELLMHELKGLTYLERLIEKEYNVKKVHIVTGDSDKNINALYDMGKLAGRFIYEVVEENWIVAVGGGKTIAEVSRNIPGKSNKKGITIVPARGGLGEEVEIQANTIAAKIAQRLGASYRLLYVPDSLEEDTREKLLKDQRIQEVISLLKRADILLHGIGIPEEMAKRRGLKGAEVQIRTKEKPAGEAFGYYFASDGRVLISTPTVGCSSRDLEKYGLIIAVAGGSRKAEAILSVMNAGFIDVLITDQGAAEGIIAKKTDNQ